MSCSPADSLDIATTAEIQDSGLLDELRRQSGQRMRVHATDSDPAVRMLEDQVVDFVMGRASDEVRRTAGHESTWIYRTFAYNRTVLVGPPDDPADVRSAPDGADAVRRIADSSSAFISHGLDAGMRALEQSFWPYALPTLRPSRQGVTGTLRWASERRGYTLVNEALFRRFEQRLDLAVVFTRDPRLVNIYAVIYQRGNARAGRFGEWLTRGGGRARIASYRVNGHPVFAVWPEGCPDSHLERQPCRLNAGGKPIKDEMVYVDGIGPPATFREMTFEADAVVVARYTGRSREFPPRGPSPYGPPLPRVDRLGQFEIREVVKPHPEVPVAGRLEIAVPGSYQEFPTYILHAFADGTDEPVAGRTYVIFVRHVRARGDEWLASAWSAYSTYDISGEFVKALRSRGTADRERTPAEFLTEIRRAAADEAAANGR